MQYQNDQWTLDDTLGMGAVADQLAQMALQVSAPFTIGVTGKWGSGKTSILRRSYATLGGLGISQPLAFSDRTQEEDGQHELYRYDKAERQPPLKWSTDLTATAANCRCVWFSPWQHQNETNPLIPLLLEIQQQFSSWTKIKDGASEYSRRGVMTAVTLIERLSDAALTFTSGKNVKLATGMTEQLHQAWQGAVQDSTPVSDGQRFHLLFEDAVEALLGADQAQQDDLHSNARLVIFIDDLDRCEEAIIVRLLEAIKLYLNSKRCIFVLGLDDTAVIHALGRYWKRSEDLNREYLEKLFQTRIPVPLPHTAQLTTKIGEQLEKHEIGTHRSALMAGEIERLLEPNPRKVKNFVNSICAAWAMTGAAGWVTDDEEAQRFVMFHYLQQYHRSIWRLLERQPEVLCFLWVVITGAAESELPKPQQDELDIADQRMLMEMLRRAFSHVLPHNNQHSEGEDKHGLEDLDSAISQFIQRQDRKRSDEYLRRMFKSLIQPDYILNPGYLYADDSYNNQ